GDGPLAIVEIADIALDDHDTELLGRRLGGSLITRITGRHREAGFLQPLDDGVTDTPRSTGDDGNPTHGVPSPVNVSPAIPAITVPHTSRRPCRRRCRASQGPSWRRDASSRREA